ncbi:hypothetical protein [Ruegeria sp. HKCCA6707]|uniref:hypothetical protein n=1 Tax=Ruegeria sp. HKCCA6707 TaxID=2682996 RepID=UPI001489A423|nr:hypothetical protein [Ruegeria sp. HKCCA6707]
MSIKRRLTKLEARSTVATVPLIVFYQIHDIKEGTEETSRIIEKSIGLASIPGFGFEWIEPHDEESEIEFRRRVHAIRAGGKLTENMNAEELTAAYAVADQELKECGDDD